MRREHQQVVKVIVKSLTASSGLNRDMICSQLRKYQCKVSQDKVNYEKVTYGKDSHGKVTVIVWNYGKARYEKVRFDKISYTRCPLQSITVRCFMVRCILSTIYNTVRSSRPRWGLVRYGNLHTRLQLTLSR